MADPCNQPRASAIEKGAGVEAPQPLGKDYGNTRMTGNFVVAVDAKKREVCG